MSHAEQEIQIRAVDGGVFSALWIGAGADAPAVLLIQEIFGINDNMRRTARLLAAQGYAVCVPDLFWRLERSVNLDPAIDAQRQHAMQLNHAFDETLGLSDLGAVIGELRRTHARVGSMGFCLGGRLAYELGVRGVADCNVGFYGVGIEQRLGPGHALRTPVLLHVAGQDHLCPPAAQEAIIAGLADQPLAQVLRYPQAGHGFARLGGAAHRAADADRAWQATFGFLAGHLRDAA